MPAPVSTARSQPAKPKPKPRSRPGRLGKIARAVLFVPSYATYLLRVMGWKQRLMVGFSLGLVAGIGLFIVFSYRAKERVNGEITAEWKKYDGFANKLDTEGMKSCLDRLDGLKPGDPLVTSRRKALENGEGDPTDGRMVSYWMNRHWTEKRFDAAAREAAKMTVINKEDWLARCILADQALQAKKKPEALAHLDALPSPLVAKPPVTPGLVAYSLALFRHTEKDDSSLRQYRVTRIVPVLRFPDLRKEDPRLALQILDSYANAFEDLQKFPELTKYLYDALNVAEFIVDDPKMDTQSLIGLGKIQFRLLAITDYLITKETITAETAKAPVEKLLEAQMLLWAKVREQNPAVPEGYIGPAFVENRRGQARKSLEWLDQGARATNDNLEMLRVQQLFLQQIDPKAAFVKLGEAVDRNPKSEAVWRMVADTAMKSQREDLALIASREARKLAPNERWAAVLQAQLCLDREKFGEAKEALANLKHLIMKDPEVTGLHARYLCQSGLRSEVGPFLEQLADETPSIAVATPAMRACLNAGHTVLVSEAAQKIDERFQKYDHDLNMILGDCYLTMAAPTADSPKWNIERARLALNALNRVQQEKPDVLALANNISWLYLKAFGAVDEADRTAEVLRKAERDGRLSESMMGTLGMVELAKGRYDEARKLLERSIAKGATAGKCAELAIAFYHLNNRDQARACLDRGSGLQPNPGETLELLKAQALLDGKKP